MDSAPVLLSLIGEQPIPNVLPVRAVKPDRVVLVSTAFTARVCQNLTRLLRPEVHVDERQVDPFDMMAIQGTLRALCEERGWRGESLLFNLTGGTKPMAFAAYRLAEELGCDFVYLQSQGGRSLLYRYGYTPGSGYRPLLRADDPVLEIGDVVTIDDYFSAHGIWDLKPAGEKPAERMIRRCLEPEVSEVAINLAFAGNMEVDLIIRQKNQVGIAEVKCRRKVDAPSHPKRPIEQLIMATEQRYLGTYTKKLLILDRPLEENSDRLATAYRVAVIVLPSLGAEQLTNADKTALIGRVKEALGV